MMKDKGNLISEYIAFTKPDVGRDDLGDHIHSNSDTDGDAPLLIMMLRQVGLWHDSEETSTLPISFTIDSYATIRLVWSGTIWDEYEFAHSMTAQIAAYILRSEIIEQQWIKSVQQIKNKEDKTCHDTVTGTAKNQETMKSQDTNTSTTVSTRSSKDSRTAKAHKKYSRKRIGKAKK